MKTEKVQSVEIRVASRVRLWGCTLSYILMILLDAHPLPFLHNHVST
jgi:hypothetical protein